MKSRFKFIKTVVTEIYSLGPSLDHRKGLFFSYWVQRSQLGGRTGVFSGTCVAWGSWEGCLPLYIPEDLSPQMAQMCLTRDPGLVDGQFMCPMPGSPGKGLMSSEMLTLLTTFSFKKKKKKRYNKTQSQSKPKPQGRN